MIDVAKLYAPVIVLLSWAALRAVGVGLSSMALVVMAIAVYLHVRAEHKNGL